MLAPTHTFSTDCTDCPRLAAHLAAIRQRDPDWHARPVPSFGSLESRLLVVGLGPGERGANRTGRPFTGDIAGELLYPSLHKFGFATEAWPLNADGWANTGLELKDCRITNAVRCLPPQNKPLPVEIRQCNDYLGQEIASMPNLQAILILGAVAHQAVLRTFGLKVKDYPFGHAVRHVLPGGVETFTSYHCSGYNTRTGRLTTEGFEAVVGAIRDKLDRLG